MLPSALGNSVRSLWTNLRLGPLKVLVVGGGNWGTVVGSIIAGNAKSSYVFSDSVYMWIHEESYEGKKLTDIINETQENPKYLPGHKLPSNLIASNDLNSVTKDADLIVIVTPHQFVKSVCESMKAFVKPSAHALSLVKGLFVEDDHVPVLVSDTISSILGIPCSALSGANVAADIIKHEFCESTLGYRSHDTETASMWIQLMDTPFFKINGVPDVAGVQVCGALKNVVALAAGFCDGLKYGTNTKSAIIRIGVQEMRLFASLFFDGILEETFFDSSGYADVITTCFGGRNVRCAAEFVKRGGGDGWEKIEADLLNGQKLQGNLTCREIYSLISYYNMEELFPLFSMTYRIAFQGAPAASLIECFGTELPRPIQRKEICTPSSLGLFARQKYGIDIKSDKQFSSRKN